MVSVPEISLGGGWSLDKSVVESTAGFGGWGIWRGVWGSMERTEEVVPMVLLGLAAVLKILPEPRKSHPSSGA